MGFCGVLGALRTCPSKRGHRAANPREILPPCQLPLPRVWAPRVGGLQGAAGGSSERPRAELALGPGARPLCHPRRLSKERPGGA